MNDISKSLMREGFSAGLIEMAERHPEIVCLGLDISKSVGVDKFKEVYPDRFFSLGIAEQNAASIAAGLSLSGKIPVFSTYSTFISTRSLDQIRVSICYNNLHVIIGGAHAGISVGPDGASHQALEDIAIMRSLPNMTVLCPCDANETKQCFVAAVEQISGPVFIRYAREALANFTNPVEKIFPGKSKLLKSGKDIGIIACGSMVYTSLKVSELLEKYNIYSSVLNLYSIKPIDKEAIINLAKITNKIITLEEHQISGGMGSAVSEVLSQNFPVKIKILGIKDTFGESGTPQELLFKYNLNEISIFNSIQKFLNEN
jgi:transketolase